VRGIGRGKGMGVFQLTNQPISAAQAYNIPFAADYAANMLAEFRRTLSRRAPNFTTDQLNQAMAAAYNKGQTRRAIESPMILPRSIAGRIIKITGRISSI